MSEESVNLLKTIVASKKGGEVRTQQETAVREIEKAITSDTNLLLEAPTGSGKTLSYMIPLVQTERKAVVSTATKQLSEQIMDEDVPFLQKVLKDTNNPLTLSAALLKGRDNYFCLAKAKEMEKMDLTSQTLFADAADMSGVSEEGAKIAAESQKLVKWAGETTTGDRSHAPAVSDQTWRQYSSNNAECPGKTACPFGDVCFAEYARSKAKEAQVVITNHAIVAQDLSGEGQLLGEREVFVFDELHELDNYLSSAWGSELTVKRLKDAFKLFNSAKVFTETAMKDYEKVIEEFPKVMRSMAAGLIDNDDAPRSLGTLLTTLFNATSRIAADAGREAKATEAPSMKKLFISCKKIAEELNEAANILSDDSVETVRWTVDKRARTFKKAPPKNSRFKAKTPEAIPEAEAFSLHAAPLRIGPKLQSLLRDRDALMVGTSATITVGGKFDIPLHNLGLDKEKSHAVKLDTPFDYRKQAMFYIPRAGEFPEPTGADRLEHTAAVQAQTVELVKAAGGRSLILSTTSAGATSIADNLRLKAPDLDVLAQGEASNGQLVKYFKEYETSTLVGTMGFWHGLDAPGRTLSLVIMDKLPFKPMDDPLATARRNYADKTGRNGFMDVYVAEAETMFRQGFGRAIRSRSDKAVIVCFDVRLLTKNYGRGILSDLYNVGVFYDKDVVLSALKRLADS